MSDPLSKVLDQLVRDLEHLLAMRSIPEEAKGEIRARYRSILMHRRRVRAIDGEERIDKQ